MADTKFGGIQTIGLVPITYGFMGIQRTMMI